MTRKNQHRNGKGAKRKKILAAAAAVAVFGVAFVFALSLYGKHQMSKIPELSFEEALAYTTKGNDKVVITVGIIKDGSASYTVYGRDGKILPQEPHTYEIGSLTKTFTAAMISRAVQEGKINLSAAIDLYLDLPDGNVYPTVEELLTHTSGYKGYYFEAPMISNFFNGRNDFYGITKDMVLDRAGSLSLPEGEYDFNYSNFGYAVLGLVLESVYGEDYTALMNRFLQDDLGLSNTRISDMSGDLENYWAWNSGDAYLSAGAITSDIDDMLAYAQMQLEGLGPFASCHGSLKNIDAATAQYKMMGINMDEIGMAWIIDRENGIVWHNGGTGDYNSYLGFDPETGTAVVILSNLSPSYRIPATVLGAKLMITLSSGR